ncbi:hypothetical protein APR11_002253 [Nocardia amikacinitolerans]|nr:hypothetical protein [Nocardia amikacinitolerans]MCP2295835.1 hypothetical protein [Nocardia amikacinitolerans]
MPRASRKVFSGVYQNFNRAAAAAVTATTSHDGVSVELIGRAENLLASGSRKRQAPETPQAPERIRAPAAVCPQ